MMEVESTNRCSCEMDQIPERDDDVRQRRRFRPHPMTHIELMGLACAKHVQFLHVGKYMEQWTCLIIGEVDVDLEAVRAVRAEVGWTVSCLGRGPGEHTLDGVCAHCGTRRDGSVQRSS